MIGLLSLQAHPSRLEYRNYLGLEMCFNFGVRVLLDEVDEAFQHNHEVGAVHAECRSAHHGEAEIVLNLRDSQ
jgi:hypothetical protein